MSKSEFWGNVLGIATAVVTAPVVAAVSVVDAVVDKKSFVEAWRENEPGF